MAYFLSMSSVQSSPGITICMAWYDRQAASVYADGHKLN